jgi:hypothetical protein
MSSTTLTSQTALALTLQCPCGTNVGTIATSLENITVALAFSESHPVECVLCRTRKEHKDAPL